MRSYSVSGLWRHHRHRLALRASSHSTHYLISAPPRDVIPSDAVGCCSPAPPRSYFAWMSVCLLTSWSYLGLSVSSRMFLMPRAGGAPGCSPAGEEGWAHPMGILHGSPVPQEATTHTVPWCYVSVIAEEINKQTRNCLQLPLMTLQYECKWHFNVSVTRSRR